MRVLNMVQTSMRRIVYALLIVNTPLWRVWVECSLQCVQKKSVVSWKNEKLVGQVATTTW